MAGGWTMLREAGNMEWLHLENRTQVIAYAARMGLVKRKT
jgi:hypothetical protein